MYLVSSKHFSYALIFGSIIHNGLTFSSSVESVKHLKPFLPKETLLDIIVLPLFTLVVLYGVFWRKWGWAFPNF